MIDLDNWQDFPNKSGWWGCRQREFFKVHYTVHSFVLGETEPGKSHRRSFELCTPRLEWLGPFDSRDEACTALNWAAFEEETSIKGKLKRFLHRISVFCWVCGLIFSIPTALVAVKAFERLAFQLIGGFSMTCVIATAWVFCSRVLSHFNPGPFYSHLKSAKNPFRNSSVD